MNIRELDEESRRTGVWPPRRIILRVEDGEPEAAEPVKVGEVDLNGPRAAVATPKGQEAPPLAPSLSPSVTPSRRRGLPGYRGVTPAPAASPEDAEFAQWIASPLPESPSEPEYQEPPAWLPDDVRVRAGRRHRRVARKARTQLFGASAATTLAIGGCAAALAVIGLSQTESVGGSLGVPSIGLFGTAPEPANDAGAEAAKPKPAARRSAARRTRPARPRASTGRSGSAAAGSTRTARSSTGASTRRASSTPAASPRPAAPVSNPPPPVQQQRRVSNPPPPPPASSPPPPAAPPVVWNAPSQAAAPSRPATSSPSRPVASAPAPTTSAPAP